MTDIRALGNAIPLIKARLADTWGAAARIAEEIPAHWSVLNGGPLVVVSDDGGPVTWPVYAKPIIRVSCYANGKQTARHIRDVSMGALLNTPIPGVGNLHSTGIGYTDARDPDTGADVASFTVTSTVMTQIVT